MTRTRAVLSVFAISLFVTTAIARDKQYELVVSRPVQAGSVQLSKGKYQLEVDGTTAVLYQGKKEIGKVPVRSEEAVKKIEITGVNTAGDKVTAFELGGTKTRLVVAGQ